ncbi:MAG: glycosyltransferase [Paludibacteraceae bacterium]|nr:glycosyltransferase [Paludibacteraceae bacterium]
MKPLVSVIVPMYNAAPFVRETLESVLASTYRPLEVVVVNDGSTDDSLAVALAVAAKHQEIKVISQKNAGVSVARNHAIREASGEWILPVDADDKISTIYIEHAVAAIADDVRVISCRAQFFGAREGEWHLPDYSPELLARKNMIHVTSLFRKVDWQRVGGFCEEDIYREDWDFWLSMMSLGGRYVRLDEIGLYYRVQPHSRRHTAKAQKRAIVDAINRRHPDYMKRYLGGKLHYHRSLSKWLNLFYSVHQEGDFTQWYDGQVIFQRRNTLRRVGNVVVKQFAVPSIARGLIYGLFCKSKARRSYEYALRMKSLTPTPIAYREERIFGILRESWYACQASECTHTFNELIGALDFPDREIILQSIGRFTAELHQRGILHRDYSGGNILFSEDGSCVEVIDLNRIKFCKHLSRSERLCNFERLNIDREALRIMAQAYAEAMHEDASEDAEYIISHRWHKHIKQGITNL